MFVLSIGIQYCKLSTQALLAFVKSMAVRSSVRISVPKAITCGTPASAFLYLYSVTYSAVRFFCFMSTTSKYTDRHQPQPKVHCAVSTIGH